MNMKQKLTYMLIGSLFTLAGYFLATLANNQPPNAQDSTTKVFDKIVCKELEVVNKDGTPIAHIEPSGPFGTGDMTLFDPSGDARARIGASVFGGFIILHSPSGKTLRLGNRGDGGFMHFLSEDDKEMIKLGESEGGGGKMLFYNKDGKALVGIGPNQDRPNNGIIYVYDHKGEWRSITAD